MWALHSISASSRFVRDVAPSQKGRIPALPHGVANVDQHIQTEQAKFPSTPIDYSSRPLDRNEKDRMEDSTRRLIETTLTERQCLAFDAFPPMLPVDQMKQGSHHDQGTQRLAQSPPRSSSGSIFGSAPSPMQSQQSSRTLPSPSSFPYPPSASAMLNTFSPTHSQATYTSHLQDLQHQISTKTLALQTLQGEHEQLLAAFSRSQMRCSTLDKKSQVSDHEINTLTEENIRLQQQVEAFETQVEELTRTRDEAQKRSAADGEQWRRIMTMSSQLQEKGIEESRRYKDDREAWERDRAGLQQRIQDLEAGKLMLVSSGGSEESATSISPDDILASASLDVLREEIVRLRHNCKEMDVTLQQIRTEMDEMSDAMNAISNMRERIKSKTRYGFRETE